MLQQLKKRRFGSSSIANTLSIVLLVIIVVVFSILGTFMFSSTRSILVKQQESMLQTKTQALVSQFDALFKEKGSLVKQMSTNNLFKQYIETTEAPEMATTSPHAAEVAKTLAAIVKVEPTLQMHGLLVLPAKVFISSTMVRHQMLLLTLKNGRIISQQSKQTACTTPILILTSLQAIC